MGARQFITTLFLVCSVQYQSNILNQVVNQCNQLTMSLLMDLRHHFVIRHLQIQQLILFWILLIAMGFCRFVSRRLNLPQKSISRLVSVKERMLGGVLESSPSSDIVI